LLEVARRRRDLPVALADRFGLGEEAVALAGGDLGVAGPAAREERGAGGAEARGQLADERQRCAGENAARARRRWGGQGDRVAHDGLLARVVDATIVHRISGGVTRGTECGRSPARRPRGGGPGGRRRGARRGGAAGGAGSPTGRGRCAGRSPAWRSGGA